MTDTTNNQPRYPMSSQHSTFRSHTYQARALAALLETQTAPKHHVAYLAEKCVWISLKRQWNGDGRTKYPNWVNTSNHRWGSRRFNGLLSPNQKYQQRNSITINKNVFKWYWQLSTRRWWERQSHKYNKLHQTLGYYSRPKTDLWTNCGGLSPTEGRPIPHTPHSGQRFN